MSTASGKAAEEVAVHYLEDHGYKIMDRNWRTRWCEIDVVAIKSGIAHFVEVKYRASSKWGSGLEYITYKKFQQMRFAAEFWLTKHHWVHESVLAAMELDGEPPKVITFLSDI